MARRKSDEKFAVEFNQTFFVNVNMGTKDLETFDAWLLENDPDIPEYLDSVLTAGDKISVAYDLQNNSILASLLIRDSRSKAHGAILTARSNVGLDALILVMYKRLKLFDENDFNKSEKTVVRG